MIIIFQMLIKISLQVSIDSDYIAKFIECLHLQWYLSNQLNDHDQTFTLSQTSPSFHVSAEQVF